MGTPERAREVEVVHLGRLGYEESLARQEEALRTVLAGGTESLFLVEHPHVYTTGRGGNAENLRGAPERLGVPIHRVSRGGDATYHGPGQIVGYPILRLEGRERDVRDYLRRLEEVLIRTLDAFGLRGARVEGRTGVWVGSRKIASIGVGIRRWATFHGFALNVDPDLDYFAAIVPCALDGITMTSMRRELGHDVDLEEVRTRLASELGEVFHRSLRGDVTGAVARRGRGYAARLSAGRPTERKPGWLKAKMPGSGEFFRTRGVLRDLGLHTVCQEAMCPNLGECWAHGTATFLILGETCTRSCGFCAVRHGRPTRVDPGEPTRIAEAVERLGLRHVVVTSVNRDDLPDGGAAQFAATARAIEERLPECAVEVLIPDLQGDAGALREVVDSPIAVLSHNTETVPRLYPRVRPGARYERSLELLSRARRLREGLVVKSGLMVGLGETDDELLATFRDLRAAGCEVLTVGQYLRPTREHLPVERYVTPEEFGALGTAARKLGFRHVESAPLVRSSYHAWEHVPSDAASRVSGARPNP